MLATLYDVLQYTPGMLSTQTVLDHRYLEQQQVVVSAIAVDDLRTSRPSSNHSKTLLIARHAMLVDQPREHPLPPLILALFVPIDVVCCQGMHVCYLRPSFEQIRSVGLPRLDDGWERQGRLSHTRERKTKEHPLTQVVIPAYSHHLL